MRDKILLLADKLLWIVYYNCGNIIHKMRQKYHYIHDKECE